MGEEGPPLTVHLERLRQPCVGRESEPPDSVPASAWNPGEMREEGPPLTVHPGRLRQPSVGDNQSLPIASQCPFVGTSTQPWSCRSGFKLASTGPVSAGTHSHLGRVG